MRPICLRPQKPSMAPIEPVSDLNEENGLQNGEQNEEVVKIDLFNLINRFEEHPQAQKRKKFLRSKSKSFSAGDRKRPEKKEAPKEEEVEELSGPIRVKRLLSRFENNGDVEFFKGGKEDTDVGERISKLEKSVKEKVREFKQLKKWWEKELQELIRLNAKNGERGEENCKRLLDLKKTVNFELNMSMNVKNIASGDYSKQEGENCDRHDSHVPRKVSEIKSKYEIPSDVKVNYPVAPKEPQKPQPIENVEEKAPFPEHEQEEDFHIPNNYVKQLSQVYEQNNKPPEIEEEPKPLKTVITPEDHGITSARMITSYFNTLSNSNTPETTPQTGETEESIPVQKNYVRKLSQVYEQNLKKSTESENPEEELEQQLDSLELDEEKPLVEEIPVEKNFVRNLSQVYEDNINKTKDEQEDEEEEEVVLTPDPVYMEEVVELAPEVVGEETKKLKKQEEGGDEEGEDSVKEDFVDVNQD